MNAQEKLEKVRKYITTRDIQYTLAGEDLLNILEEK